MSACGRDQPIDWATADDRFGRTPAVSVPCCRFVGGTLLKVRCLESLRCKNAELRIKSQARVSFASYSEHGVNLRFGGNNRYAVEPTGNQVGALFDCMQSQASELAVIPLLDYVYKKVNVV